MNRFYFIDKKVYYLGKKQPYRKVEIFNVTIYKDFFTANDKDGNQYKLDRSELIIEDDSVSEVL